MNEIRCKNCNEILEEGEKYCLFCGTKQVDTPIKTDSLIHQDKKKDLSSIWAFIGVFILLIVGGMIGSKIIAGIGIFLIAYLIRSKLDGKDKQKSSKNNRIILVIVGIVLFLVFILGFSFSNTDTNQIDNSESYTFEIEPEYRQVKPITIEEFTGRLENHLKNKKVEYQNIAMEEEYSLFKVQINIVNIDDNYQAVDVFKQLINSLSNESEDYTYIRDLKVSFYTNNEFQYSIRLYNLFLINVLDLEKDGVFYDVRSDISVLLKSLEDKNFSFPETKNIQTLSDKEEKYQMDYNVWYDDFDVLLDEVYFEFIRVNDQFIDEGVNPTQKELNNLENLTSKLAKRCDLFNEIEVVTYYEVFHQYFARGCQYYVSGFKKNLEGIEKLNIDKINYSYLDYIIGYDYFGQAFGSEDN